MTAPFDRLKCHCVFTESAKKLEAHIDALDHQTRSARINALEQSLALLREEHRKHVTEHVHAMNRSLIEFYKRRSIMSPTANGTNGAVLKTSPWGAGEIRELQNPANKKKSKRGQKTQKKRARVSEKSLGLEGVRGGDSSSSELPTKATNKKKIGPKKRKIKND